jgi:hypothetical protein
MNQDKARGFIVCMVEDMQEEGVLPEHIAARAEEMGIASMRLSYGNVLSHKGLEVPAYFVKCNPGYYGEYLN